jgi:hypothetical protein
VLGDPVVVLPFDELLPVGEPGVAVTVTVTVGAGVGEAGSRLSCLIDLGAFTTTATMSRLPKLTNGATVAVSPSWPFAGVIALIRPIGTSGTNGPVGRSPNVTSSSLTVILTVLSNSVSVNG